jgi:UDP-N-acetylmuramate--alanine ligase
MQEETKPEVNIQTAQGWQNRLMAGDTSLRIHLLGIGGAGLSAIAHVLNEQGFQVSGSDRQIGPGLQRLADQGVRVFGQQVAANLVDLPAAERPDVVLISSAVDVQNPERQAAVQLGIPVVKRSDFLPVWLAHRKVIGVAGSAGKTTTTAMVVKTLRDAGVDAGYIIGAELPGYGNAAAGTHPFFVVEADEYDHMFLALRPTVAVITNVTWDHPDCYPTPESFWEAFRQYTANVQPDGLVITCADDLGAERLYEERSANGPHWITYGLADFADVQALHPQQQGHEQLAELRWWYAPKGEIRLSVPGVHNLRNALATLAVASFCDIPSRVALESLRTFGGTARRFELKGEVNGITVIDDYAHHPIKVQATLSAARSRYGSRRIWAVLQPHTFSRTKELLNDFAASFGDVDRVLITDIFAAREKDDGSIHARDLVAACAHPHVRYVAELQQAADLLVQETEPGDVVVIMGAGDSYKVGNWLLEQLRQQGNQ